MIFEGNEYTDSYQRLLGDVDLDGDVDAADLTKLARHVSKIETITDPQSLINADVTFEGDVAANDLTKLARYVSHIIDSLEE